TVTDANLLLGRLDPEAFAGGAIPLSVENADAAMLAHVAEPLGAGREDAAFGVTEMVDENMANAARVHTVENGRDIESFTMIAFGGGAPLHACRLCEKLGISEAIIPPGAGVGSAIGFLKAPFSFEASRGLFQRLDTFDRDAVKTALAGLEDEARSFVSSGAGARETKTSLTAFMRYAGQGWEIPVDLTGLEFAVGVEAKIRAAFEDAYRTFFGRIIEGLSVEVTNWSLVVATTLPDVRPVERLREGTPQPGVRSRSFFDAGERKFVEASEVHRAVLGAGQAIDGPALIVEDETTTIVTSAFRAVGQFDGSLRLMKKEGAR
ncbi:MAG: hydantoinase/oxoprolinase family protein, partial [Pseudomonadota bacterium]